MRKCIGCLAGLSPITFSERALEAVKKRKNPVRSWYLDISLIEKYWSTERVYHHTSSSTLNYSLLEKFKPDIGGRFGRLKGKVWRLGLMGYSSSADNVLFFIPAISRALALQGHKTDLAAGLDAVLSELDGNGNHVVALREEAAVAAL